MERPPGSVWNKAKRSAASVNAIETEIEEDPTKSMRRVSMEHTVALSTRQKVVYMRLQNICSPPPPPPLTVKVREHFARSPCKRTWKSSCRYRTYQYRIMEGKIHWL